MFESDLFGCKNRIETHENREKLNTGNDSMAAGLRLLLFNPDILCMNSLEVFDFHYI